MFSACTSVRACGVWAEEFTDWLIADFQFFKRASVATLFFNNFGDEPIKYVYDNLSFTMNGSTQYNSTGKKTNNLTKRNKHSKG